MSCMVFSSYVFAFAFLPLTLILYFSLAHFRLYALQKWVLVAASLFFYGYFRVEYLLIICSSIIVNYLLALVIQKYGNKLSCIIGVLFNIGILGYFKYYDFFVDNLNTVFGLEIPLKHLLLPLGISFFTFQQLSFLISVYKKEEQVSDFVSYASFVLFFPQLVAGPIVLYSEMIPQFNDKNNLHCNPDNIATGFYMFTLGLFKKLVVADSLAVVSTAGFALNGYTAAASWVTMLTYAFQLYFDFSGYSDMAIGLGRMFNINLPLNFDSPYKSAGIGEFWRRWHITLGRAIRSYIYFPMGGSRKGKVRTYLNLVFSFIVSGFWHGAAWTFILWGFLHGVLCALEKLFEKQWSKIPHILRVGMTFLAVSMLFVIFNASSVGKAVDIIRGLVNIGDLGIWQVGGLMADGIIGIPVKIGSLLIYGVLLLLGFVVFGCRNVSQLTKSAKPTTRSAILIAVMFVLCVVHMSRGAVFIYFNF